MTESQSEIPALDVDGLSYSFKGHKALQGVSFTVRTGTIHGFVGPNGAGKTTSLKIISTLLDVQRGSVMVFGDSVKSKVFKVRRSIGYMPDHFGMYRQMTVFEYLDFFAAAYGMPTNKRTDVIDEILELTDMAGRRSDLIKGLSRGMEQRVSLARVLVHDPKLLLLDEPASGLDPRARIELMAILRELASMGKTVFISSHILSELAELCDDVTIIDRGQIKYTGAMRGLLALSGDLRVYDVQLESKADAVRDAVAGLAGVVDANWLESSQPVLRVSFHEDQTNTGGVLQAVLGANGNVLGFQEGRRHLDQAFLDLTEPGVRT